MEYAIHSVNDIKVSASDPSITRGPYFICPICRAPVHLRRGRGKVPHFAHNYKQAKVDCELYFSIDAAEFYQKNNSEREAPYRSLGLYLRVLDENKPSMSWSLEISIPEPDVSIGTIRLPFALGGQRTIPISTIKSGGQRVRIPPGPGPFYLVCDNVPEGRWKNRINLPIPGLSTKDLNVFRYSPFSGRRLNDNSPFYWGRSYVLLWTISSKPKSIPSQEIIQNVPLRGYTSWDGIFIQLPIIHNKQVEKWLTGITGRSILHPPAELELITPMAENRLSDGSYVIQDGGEVNIGIIGEPGARKWNKISCYNSNTGVTKTSQREGSVPALIQLQLNPGRNDIWLDNDIEGNKSIIVDPNVSYTTNIPGISLFAMDNKTLQEFEVLLTNEEAAKLIKKAYEGTVTFTKVNIPSYLNIKIKWKDSKNEEQELNRLAQDEHNSAFEFEEKMLNVLNSLDKQKQSYFSIDAGVFGNLKFEPELNLNMYKRPDKGLNLGQKWRDRANHILNLSRALKNEEYTFIHKKVELSLFCERDQKLLTKIISQGTWPLILAPHCWTLLKEAEQIISLYSNRYGVNYK
ncbi:competence protein CoiA family protein [Bacillus sp. T33-2]|uniref:competence protein CoiA family protein n=1 Tax=Bacillus sp. T33-2 TaxID=2054168 RepID=UPI000C7708AF|nr:competence protein CoiA family protein [Bacillus sp. T33-2]PLR92035.1 hypothetical protein CVD19_21040 [Bacillus sp. T33-2]